MSEYSGRPDEKKAQAWADRIPDDLEDREGVTWEVQEAHEEVYRDGSVRHECWHED
ncbi:MAG: hypothetical protein IJ246_09190 [Clostridia bacterium]|nr:hypothetical protein [Clostridia bacterium]